MGIKAKKEENAVELNDCKSCDRQPNICRIGSDGWGQMYQVQIVCPCKGGAFVKASNDRLAVERWNIKNEKEPEILVLT